MAQAQAYLAEQQSGQNLDKQSEWKNPSSQPFET
jgi:hypothetical protein